MEIFDDGPEESSADNAPINGKKIKLTIDAHIERRVDHIDANGKEDYRQDPTPSEELRRKIQQIDFSKLVQAGSLQDLGAVQSKQSQQHILMSGTIREVEAVLLEIDLLYQTLTKFREKTSLLGMIPVHKPRAPEEKQLRELKLKQAIKQKSFENVSNILLEGAKELDRVVETSQVVEQAAMDIRSRWPLSGKGNNLQIDYSYQNSKIRFREVGEAGFLRSLVPESGENRPQGTSTGVRLAFPIPHQTNKRTRFSLMSAADLHRQTHTTATLEIPTSLASPLHQKLLLAQKSLFESELFDEISREARAKERIGVLNMFEKQMTLEINEQYSLLVKVIEEDLEKGTSKTPRPPRTSLENICLTAELLMSKQITKTSKIPDPDPILEELNAITTSTIRNRKQRQIRPNALESATDLIKQYICCVSVFHLLEVISRKIKEVATSVQLVHRDPTHSTIHFLIHKSKKRVTFTISSGVVKVLLPNHNMVQLSVADLMDFVLQEIADAKLNNSVK